MARCGPGARARRSTARRALARATWRGPARGRRRRRSRRGLLRHREPLGESVRGPPPREDRARDVPHPFLEPPLERRQAPPPPSPSAPAPRSRRLAAPCASSGRALAPRSVVVIDASPPRDRFPPTIARPSTRAAPPAPRRARRAVVVHRLPGERAPTARTTARRPSPPRSARRRHERPHPTSPHAARSARKCTPRPARRLSTRAALRARRTARRARPGRAPPRRRRSPDDRRVHRHTGPAWKSRAELRDPTRARAHGAAGPTAVPTTSAGSRRTGPVGCSPRSRFVPRAPRRSAFTIDSPSPVPPYSRVDDESTW